MKRINLLRITFSIILGLYSLNTFAQATGTGTNGQINTITTAVPFLTISPDARSGGVGDLGIALSPDANGAFWNVGKMAMIDKDYGFGLTYTPWLQELNVSDIFLAHLDGFTKVGKKNNQVIGLNFRYFSLGTINYTNDQGSPIGEGNPRELAVDVYYSTKFSDKFSAGVALKYILSDITRGVISSGGTAVYSPGSGFATDFGFHYTSNGKDQNGLGNEFVAGLAISNLGPKITYDQTTRYPLPTNLGIGLGYTLQIDEYNEITFLGELNKLLVPTPQLDSAGRYYYPDETVISGIFGSFSDAPGGSEEEMREWIFQGGVEYWYQDQFALRGGYFFEDATKGARQYLSVGVGLKYNVLGFNFSYIIPTNTNSGVRMPLSNTLRFSLLAEFDKGQSQSTTSETTASARF